MDWEESFDVIEEIEDEEEEKITEPPMYKVIMYNDHYTTMEFVVYILEKIFHKSLKEAVRIMLNIHNKGLGICGVYPAEVAETKIQTVHQIARDNEFPLKCGMEEE
ncbi:ATP-dependent Clp protease adaptor protein ClpS [Candidatus Magnetomorum sp. HK-1]|nr:ATP-dependent Clp protease adaptor protein ClpS [Candidatus Magnetomorum sp. HK-1]